MNQSSLKNNRIKFKTYENLITDPIKKNLENIPQFNKENPRDVNMSPVGLGNTTRISTNHAQMEADRSPSNKGCQVIMIAVNLMQSDCK